MGDLNPIGTDGETVIQGQTVMLQFNLSDYEKRLLSLESKVPALSGDVQKLQGFVEGTITSFKLVEQRLDHLDLSLNDKIDTIRRTVETLNGKVEAIDNIRRTVETLDGKVEAIDNTLIHIKDAIEQTSKLVKDGNKSIKGMDWWVDNGMSPLQITIGIWIGLGIGLIYMLHLLKNLF